MWSHGGVCVVSVAPWRGVYSQCGPMERCVQSVWPHGGVCAVSVAPWRGVCSQSGHMEGCQCGHVEGYV